MADKHPYVSGSGSLVKVIDHFRKSFPGRVTAETLQKLGFAPKNESYVLNVLRFLGLIDQEGKRTDSASKVFNVHDDAAFSQEFAKLVKKAYNDLFDLHGESAWTLDRNSLITFFRSTDDTTAIVGKRQASTFQLLAAFSGHKELPAKKAAVARPSRPATEKREKTATLPRPAAPPGSAAVNLPAGEARAVGLTVRVEINLPAAEIRKRMTGYSRASGTTS